MRRERSVQVEGLRGTIDGADGAPWIVFSNSLATDLSIWNPQVEALAFNYCILRYDYRGHGASAPNGTTHFDMCTLASDLLKIMDAAKIDYAHHVGVSMGSLAGIAAAAASPGRFRSLVISNARLRSSQESAASLEQRTALALSGGMGSLVGVTLDKWFGKSSPPVGNPLLSRIENMIRDVSASNFAAYAGGMREYDMEGVLEKLATPMLFVAGTNDGAIAQDFERIAALLRQASCQSIKGAGHLPNVETPIVFNRLLLAFLSRVDACDG